MLPSVDSDGLMVIGKECLSRMRVRSMPTSHSHRRFTFVNPRWHHPTQNLEQTDELRIIRAVVMRFAEIIVKVIKRGP